MRRDAASAVRELRAQKRYQALVERKAVDVARAIYRVPVERRMDVIAAALHVLIAGDLLRNDFPEPEED